MTQQHPITPTPELVQQWVNQFAGEQACMPEQVYIAMAAARWGADQELEACCEWLSVPCASYGRELRAARRPKPQSLNSIALQMLGTIEKMDVVIPEITDTIRRALEQLPDHE